jgi:hypothetical protein
MARLTLARKIAAITLTVWKKGVLTGNDGPGHPQRADLLGHGVNSFDNGPFGSLLQTIMELRQPLTKDSQAGHDGDRMPHT